MTQSDAKLVKKKKNAYISQKQKPEQVLKVQMKIYLLYKITEVQCNIQAGWNVILFSN